MKIASEKEYHLTQRKLADLRETIDRIAKRGDLISSQKAASLRSLTSFANQLVQELCDYEIAQGLEPILDRYSEASIH